MGDDLKKGVRSIKEVVMFDEEEITEDILQNRLKEFTGQDRRACQSITRRPGSCRRSSRRFRRRSVPRNIARYRMALARGIVQRIAGGAQSRLHQQRAQAADRTGEQDRRRHAVARPPGSEPGTQSRRDAQRRPEKRVSSARPAPSARKWRSSSRKRACCSWNSSAHSAKSSRATWTPSTPSAS